ncbi:Crp/Fnr family transcriptional regulator [Alcaligenes phenolicus]|uniref:Crp/Fnr family transcriptional regulator n=1 Tax=Alcaligenes phenolicus TaxID=232846 RepID=A0AAW5VPI2_9BURK|nr:Crp/Fnr family transcriptional regulator [Alcaligenes phenolicus]MCX5565808.1 Crp/Fnr family transcriptional regulator [Alcaligenes phenolicus]
MSVDPLSTAACEHIPALCVSRVPIFNHLPPEALAVIAEKASMRSHDRWQFIHRPGDRSNQLFIVHKGKVKVYRLSDMGKEQLVRILDPGDFAGELALFSSAEHDSYAETMQPSEICTIHQADVRELLLQYPDIGLHVLAELSRRLGASEKQTAAIATASINARLAQYLANLAEQENSTSFSLPMSRRYLASFLGTTPETVSRRLGEFEEAGWIAQTGQRKITILDLDALLLAE